MSKQQRNRSLEAIADKAFREALAGGDSLKDALLYGMLVAESATLGSGEL